MRTDYLFAAPSFLSGVARLLDLSGRFDVYNDSDDEALADARAIYSDWRMVGQDLAGAMTVWSVSGRSRKMRQPPAPVARPEPAGAETADDATVALSVQSVQHFQGPLPSPQALAQYEAVLPGCAERIVSMAEEQAAHRRALESQVITGNLVAERRGQVAAFAMALVTIVGGVWLIYHGRDVGGLTAIIGALGGLAGAFVYGRRKDAEERRQKRADFASPQIRLPDDDRAAESPGAGERE